MASVQGFRQLPARCTRRGERLARTWTNGALRKSSGRARRPRRRRRPGS